MLQGAADEHLHDLVGAAVDLLHTRGGLRSKRRGINGYGTQECPEVARLSSPEDVEDDQYLGVGGLALDV